MFFGIFAYTGLKLANSSKAENTRKGEKGGGSGGCVKTGKGEEKNKKNAKNQISENVLNCAKMSGFTDI